MREEYPYLPEGKKIDYVSNDNEYILQAKHTCEIYSTDLNHPTGAVIVKDQKVVAFGANQSGFKNKKLIEIHKNFFCLRKILKVKSGSNYWMCPGCASPKMHAEARAVKDARNKKIDINGADLYLWGHWWCCKPCWDKMIESGIKNVYLVEGATKLFKK